MSRDLRVAARARQDIAPILAFTREVFGPRQADIYGRLLERALTVLRDREDLAGSRERDDLGPNMRSFNLSRLGGGGRHIIFFRVDRDVIVVARVLHEAMDAARHIRR